MRAIFGEIISNKCNNSENCCKFAPSFHSTMKKTLKWIGIAVLSPILLFMILAALLYLPPVQNWVAGKIASIATEKTGMEISIGRVSLEWPLNLGINDFRALHQNDSLPQVKDTIADIGHLTVDIKFLPLLQKRVVINELSLQKASINTNGFISDVRIKGRMQELWLASKGIDLDRETAEVNGARLTDANIDIALSDTAAVDTTESTAKWIIKADSLSFRNSELTLHLPGDTLNVQTYLGNAVAREANIDIGNGIYEVACLNWNSGRFRYDDRFMAEEKGFDYNHIAMSDLNMHVDSFRFSPSGLSVHIKESSAKERCGIDISHMAGSIILDSLYNNIQLRGMTLRTSDSDIYTETDMDFTFADDRDPGQMKMRLNAQIGKQDMIRFLGDLPQAFIQNYPNQPISIKGSLNGNMQAMELSGLIISLPSAFNMNLNGTAGLAPQNQSPVCDLKVNAKMQDMNFLLAFADPSLRRNYTIPQGITLDGTIKADGKNNYSTNLIAHEGNGTVKLIGEATIPKDARGDMAIDYISYDADISIDNLNLHHFMPKDSLYNLSAEISAKGYGTDFLSNRSHLTADAQISHFQYGSLNLNNFTASADIHDGKAQANVTGHNELLEGTIGVEALLGKKNFDGSVSADITKADLLRLRLVNDTLAVGFKGDIDIKSDFEKTHYVSGLIGDIVIIDEKKTYHPDRIGLLLRANSDTTYVRAQSGDFIVKVDGSGDYEHIFKQMSILADSLKAQYDNRIIDQAAIKRLLPTLKLHIESKRDNPIADLLHTSDIEFKELMLDLATSPHTGVNGKSYIYSLNYDSIRIDTIRLNFTQKGERLTYQGQICNNKKNPQFVFNALLDGHFHEHGALAGLRYFDKDNRMGVRIGATAKMQDEGININLMPDRPTLGYKEFNLNKDNFIFLNRSGKVQAKVDLIADDKTGLKIYTENQDSTMLQDLTVSINRLDLGELSAVIPYMPRITGYLNGDYHILQDKNANISVASDMAVQQMTYENSPIGNISSEFVYLMKDGEDDDTSNDTHVIEARLMLDDEEFGLFSGKYQNRNEGIINATMKMTKFPMSIANGFVPDQIVGLEGHCEGTLDIHGSTKHPDVDGELFVEDAYLISHPYGVKMRFDNDPVRIVDSRILIENFGLYSYNDEPLVLMGNVDFSNTDRIMMDMRMRAQNFQLINAKQTAKSIAYGKAFVNFFARMQGPIDELNIRGRLDVLGSTDMTYLLLDSPLSTDNRLDELVKFTDFSDTTEVVVTRPMPTGLVADLNINVSDGAHIVCGLNQEQTNYVDLTGGGDLRMKYNSEGIDLKGRYTINSGVMKYSLPIIPLRTFNIKNGSYVEFTGDPMNPRLSITATERNKSTVKDESGAVRSVVFNCGVEISKTLNDMGLQFIIEAPEDNLINGELSAMSIEERGKIAVAMITTGMYLDSNSSGNFSMNSALSAFLQNEINNIAGNALKTIDISIGVESSVNSAGQAKQDFSFQFSKRFLDNRLKIQIGGLLSGGDNTNMGQKQSFFDNVSMEYRLNQEGTQNLKLFYKQNVYDWLEGYTSEYGGGFIWRRKLDKFWDIFRLRSTQQQPMPPVHQTQMTPDSVRTDSLKVESKK